MLEVLIQFAAFFFSLDSSTQDYIITAVTPAVQHAEAPFWDSDNNILYYVDTFKATALRWDARTKILTCHKFASRNSIGTITPIKNCKNEFIVSADRYLYKLEWDGKNTTGKETEIQMVEKNKPKNQFNDGKADVCGHMWLGTLERNEDLSVAPEGGCLYHFLYDKNFTCIEKVNRTSITNGITWTKDNKWLFHIDTETKIITKYRFDKNTGNISDKKVIFDQNEYPELGGAPDGMTSDSEDNLWVALFGGGAVLKIDSCTGKLLQIVKMPVTYITSAVFGGDNFETLYVTTSKLKLKEGHDEHQAGCVFAITGLGVRGYPMFRACVLN